MENGKRIDDEIVKEVFEITQKADTECARMIHRKNITASAPSVGHVFRKQFFDYLEKCSSDTPETRKIKKALFSWALRLVLHSDPLHMTIILQIYELEEFKKFLSHYCYSYISGGTV